MSTTDDFERISNAWLADGPTELADRVLDAALEEVHLTHQRRRLALWRSTHMSFLSSNMARLAAVVVVAIVALGGAFYLLGPNRGGVGGPVATPTPPPPTAAPSPSAVAQSTFGAIDTSTWTTYTSTRYGFKIGHPADWTERPADHSWTFPPAAASGAPDAMGTSTEGFIAPGQTILVSAWSVAAAAGTCAQTWMVDAYCPSNQVPSASDPAPCDRLGPGGPRVTPVTVDGHAGVLARFSEDTQAFVLVGNTMYVVACWRPESDPSVTPYLGATRLLEAYLSTMHFLPGGPAPSTTPRGT
jgi:hypothetical protein